MTIFNADYRRDKGFIETLLIIARNVYTSRELIWQLYKRDFFQQYKKSFIGMGWIFITPIVGIISWVLMNSTGILKPGDVGIPYPAYVLISTSIWGLFMGFYSASSNTLSSGGGFIKQVNYPHESLLVKQFLLQISNFGIVFILNIIVLIGFGVNIDIKTILFPIAIIPIFLFAASLGLLSDLISVVASDIVKIFNKLLGFVFYITPIIYSPDTSDNNLKTIIKLNPLTYLISLPRDLIIGEISNEMLYGYLIISVISVVMFAISLRLFYISEDKIIEKMI